MRLSIIIFVTLSLMLLSSCMATRTNVNGFEAAEKNKGAKTYNYSKAKQIYLFWGLLPIGRTSVATPFQIRTKIRFIDYFISGITLGIVRTQTIRVKALHNNSSTPNLEDNVDLQKDYPISDTLAVNTNNSQETISNPEKEIKTLDRIKNFFNNLFSKKDKEE